MARCKELLNCILLRKVLNFRNRVRKVLIEWYQFDTSFKYMAESLILDPINFNTICILLDYNFRQLLIRITFKLVQLFVKCLTWNHEKVILIKIGVFSKGKILIQSRSKIIRSHHHPVQNVAGPASPAESWLFSSPIYDRHSKQPFAGNWKLDSRYFRDVSQNFPTTRQYSTTLHSVLIMYQIYASTQTRELIISSLIFATFSNQNLKIVKSSFHLLPWQ